MKKVLIHIMIPAAFAIAAIATGCGKDVSNNNEPAGVTQVNDSLIRVLKAVIGKREAIHVRKEQEIEKVRKQCDSLPVGEEKFFKLGDLFDIYTKYNSDSCFSILERKQAIARQLGREDLKINVMLNQAYILSETGMMMDAGHIIDSISPSEVPEFLLPYYWHIRKSMGEYSYSLSSTDRERSKYQKIIDAARDTLLKSKEPGSFEYALLEADGCIKEGNYAESVRIIDDFLKDKNLSDDNCAIMNFVKSEAYSHIGPLSKEKEALIRSAISDIRGENRNYLSLSKLALMLYQEGNVEDAYTLLKISIDDAIASNARIRQLQLNEVFAIVNGVYLDSINKHSRLQQRITGVVLLLLISLFGAYLILRKQHRKVNSTRAQLARINTSLQEESAMKDSYIGKYMNLCIEYIEKIETFRRHILRMLKDGKNEDLKKELTGRSYIDDDAKVFYQNFDTAFLNIYPTFIEEFNNLLKEEDRMYPRQKGTLTPELRIFALIRLGINESSRIARFLHYTPTTIYNYRARVRNKAKAGRDTLEEDLMKIGDRAFEKPDTES